MNNFRVHYSGTTFASEDSIEEAKKRVHDRMISLGKIFDIQAIPLHPDDKEFKEGNYMVSFEGEIKVQAETKKKAESQAYDRLSNLGQITVSVFKE